MAVKKAITVYRTPFKKYRTMRRLRQWSGFCYDGRA